MKSEPCNLATLVEADHDGRLGPEDHASVARHLATCASCARLASDLAALGRMARGSVPEPTSLEVRRGRMRLLVDAARGDRPRRARSAMVPVTLGLGASIAVAASLFFALRTEPTRVALSALHLENVGAMRLVTEVRGAADAEFTRTLTDGFDLVVLREGRVDVRAKKLGPSERFVLRTADAEVEVRGTLFSVTATAGHLVGVVVTEGRVEVRPQGEPVLLDAGGAWTAPAPLAESRSLARPPPPAVGPHASATTPRPPPTSSAFRDAVSAMERGDYGAAHQQLQRYADENPSDPRAEDAAFLAILSLQRAGRPEEATVAARAYLARFPDGARRAEAAAIAAHVARDRGELPQ